MTCPKTSSPAACSCASKSTNGRMVPTWLSEIVEQVWPRAHPFPMTAPWVAVLADREQLLRSASSTYRDLDELQRDLQRFVDRQWSIEGSELRSDSSAAVGLSAGPIAGAAGALALLILLGLLTNACLDLAEANCRSRGWGDCSRGVFGLQVHIVNGKVTCTCPCTSGGRPDVGQVSDPLDPI